MEWNEVMRINLPKLALRMIFAALACIGLLSAAHATPLDTTEPAATEALLAANPPITSQYILDKYITKARHKCYQRRYARSRYCCSFDYYGACRKYCIDYAYRDYCPRHKRYYRKYRKPKYY